jgi:hypothetical protein
VMEYSTLAVKAPLGPWFLSCSKDEMISSPLG